MEKINNINLQNIPKLTCGHQIKTPNGDIRYCKNKCNNYNNNYCHVHIKLYTKIQNQVLFDNLQLLKLQSMDTQFLDEHFSYTLMGLYNSWDDMDKNEIVCIDGEYWNIYIILSHFTQQLNMSSMENPYPIYPNSPFTRKLYSIESLTILKNKLKELKLPINIALKLLLSQPIDKLQLIYNDVDQNNYSEKLLELLNFNYRYMLINSKNSQNIYMGFWVHNKMPLEPFEKLYNKLKNMPYQIIVNGYIVINNQRDIIERKMEKCVNKYDIHDKKFCEIFIQ
jgi:hypothetical protein